MKIVNDYHLPLLTKPLTWKGWHSGYVHNFQDKTQPVTKVFRVYAVLNSTQVYHHLLPLAKLKYRVDNDF